MNLNSNRIILDTSVVFDLKDESNGVLGKLRKLRSEGYSISLGTLSFLEIKSAIEMDLCGSIKNKNIDFADSAMVFFKKFASVACPELPVVPGGRVVDFVRKHISFDELCSDSQSLWRDLSGYDIKGVQGAETAKAEDEDFLNSIDDDDGSMRSFCEASRSLDDLLLDGDEISNYLYRGIPPGLGFGVYDEVLNILECKYVSIFNACVNDRWDVAHVKRCIRQSFDVCQTEFDEWIDLLSEFIFARAQDALRGRYNINSKRRVNDKKDFYMLFDLVLPGVVVLTSDKGFKTLVDAVQGGGRVRLVESFN